MNREFWKQILFTQTKSFKSLSQLKLLIVLHYAPTYFASLYLLIKVEFQNETLT